MTPKLLWSILLVAPMAAFAAPVEQGTATRAPHSAGQVQIEPLPWTMGQGRLGIRVMRMTPELRRFFGAPRHAGLLVAQVMPASPAARAGLQVGDVVTKLGGRSVSRPAELLQLLGTTERSRTVAIELVRYRRTITVHATLEPRRPSV